ncbi:MAG: hypothetical protein ACTSXW_02870 [Candidatus Baldrarchaeia archaeon]
MGERKDLLISFCIALWITVLLSSMFYIPALAEELTKEDTEKEGNVWWKGWELTAYVKGYYYSGATKFHHTYHKSEVKSYWLFPWFTSINEAWRSYKVYSDGELIYNITLEQYDTTLDWDFDDINADVATTWVGAWFENAWGKKFWRETEEEATIVI